jgi:hypothetical protein
MLAVVKHVLLIAMNHATVIRRANFGCFFLSIWASMLLSFNLIARGMVYFYLCVKYWNSARICVVRVATIEQDDHYLVPKPPVSFLMFRMHRSMQELGCEMKNSKADRKKNWENTHQLDARCVKEMQNECSICLFYWTWQSDKDTANERWNKSKPKDACAYIIKAWILWKTTKNKIDSKHWVLKNCPEWCNERPCKPARW